MVINWKNIFLTNNFWIIISVFATLVHFATLAYSPLPWFDEIYMAGITKSLITNGTYELATAPSFKSGEVLIYGPVYFALTSTSVKLFGWGAFQFRIINLLFGLGTIFLSALILNKYTNKKRYLLPFITILLLDIMFFMNSHSGRMDCVALFFVILSLFFLINYKKKTKYLFVGFSMGLAVLTTPRATIFLLPLCLFYGIPLLRLWRKDNLLKAALWAFPVVSLLLIWIYTKFGSIESYLNYFGGNKEANFGNQTLFEAFVKFSPSLRFFIFPLAGLSAGSFLLLLFRKKKKLDKVVGVLLSQILLFFLIIVDTGMYSIYIIPAFYLLLFISLKELKINRRIKFGITALIFLYNLGAFTLKSSAIFFDAKFRDHKAIDEFVAKNIPENSRVVGNEIYIYSVLKNNCDFQSIERGSNGTKKRCEYHINVFDFEYYIVSKQYYQIRDYQIEHYIKTADLEFVDSINLAPNKTSKVKLISEFFNTPTTLYSFSGSIYRRRIKRNK